MHFDETIKIIITILSFSAFFCFGYIFTNHPIFKFLIQRKNRFDSIDGLRGYLALSVFIHHFVLTWYWKNTGEWGRPPEAYFQNLGKFGIAVFFMITGFLFISKIISSNKPIDWYRLYQSRVFRIFPLYLFVIVLITIVILFQSNFQINVDVFTLLKSYFRWFIFHGNIINDYSETRRIIAGVDWTLKYEWLFYALLPLIALVIRQGKLAIILVCLGLLILFLYPVRIEYFYTLYFILFAIGGGAAALSNELKKQEKWINHPLCSLFTLVALIAAVFHPNTFSSIHVLLMTLFFVPITLGNNLFGLLNARPSIFLGEISYSIYLLHGAVLYTLFSIINFDIGHLPLTSALMWLPIIGLIVVFLSTIAYLLIERPFIQYGKNNNLSHKLKWLTQRNHH